MNLHHKPEVFEELVKAAAEELHIEAAIIEKDYCVSAVLKELSFRLSFNSSNSG